jgi:hypothetical protein
MKVIYKAIGQFFGAGCILLATAFSARAQTVSVYPTQDLSFGAFILGNSGGSVTVSHTGDRSATGDLTLANLGVFYFPATIEIEAPVGTVISILNGPNTQLSGSNGGTITLSLGTSDKGATFTTTAVSPQRTPVVIGGTLTVGNQQSNPAGNYSGTFSVTFIEQ